MQRGEGNDVGLLMQRGDIRRKIVSKIKLNEWGNLHVLLFAATNTSKIDGETGSGDGRVENALMYGKSCFSASNFVRTRCDTQGRRGWIDPLISSRHGHGLNSVRDRV